MASATKQNRKPDGKVAAVNYASKRPAAASVSSGVVGIGGVLLAFCFVITLMMVLENVAGMSLPGCGADSPCAKAAGSRWGNALGFQPKPAPRWPVSYVGFAYYAALLAAWLGTGGKLSAGARIIVRAGALTSVFFLSILVVEQHLCWYCVLSHASNLMFWLLMERNKVPGAVSARNSVSLAGTVFALATAGLAVADVQNFKKVNQGWAGERDASVEQIVKKSTNTDANGGVIIPPMNANSATPSNSTDKPIVIPPANANTNSPIAGTSTDKPIVIPPPSVSDSKPFVGRWRLGPPVSPIRIVAILDYQCVDCKRVEGEIMEEIAKDPQIALSIKYFPFSSGCNVYIKEDMHKNACWAARAAETAGMLYGQDGFWKMHNWLFEKGGGFTDAELNTGLQTLGFDPVLFVQTMQTEEPLRRVKEDVEEGQALGLHYTPMIFINGVELKGWQARNAANRAIQKLQEQKLPPAGPESDHPPMAIEKYVGDWQEQVVRKLQPQQPEVFMGPPGAPLNVTVIGDYQEPNCVEIHRIISAYMANHPNMQYTFRYFPFDKSCNVAVPETKFANGCLCARAAAAAAQVGGNAAFAKMHNWLMANSAAVSPAEIAKAAVTFGLDPTAFAAALDSPGVKASINADIAAAQGIGIQSIPMVLVNGKFMPRWKLEGQRIVERILDEAQKP